MLSKLAVAILALTSLAPVALVYGFASAANPARRITGALMVGAAAAIVAACRGLLWAASRWTPPEPLAVAKSKSADKDVLGFLLAYLLPLVSRSEKPTDVVALAVTLALLLIVIYRLQILQVNPLLGLLGFHFFEVTNESGQTHLLLTRRPTLPTSRPRAIRLSEHLWYERGP